MPDPPLIAVDWGSTNFRATLLADGKIIDRIESPEGIKNVEDRAFEAILEARCGNWRKEHPDADVLLSGMIGSREGWVEAGYAEAPAGLSDLAGDLAAVEDGVRIVPGVSIATGEDTFDVMRGEETQVFGLLKTLESENAVVCAPGTHSKWIVCRGGRIETFRTWATGETFQLLSRHSLLTGHEAATAIRAGSEAFHRGIEHSGRTGGLLHHLFLGRTDMLMGLAAPEDLPSLLSGLLLGHEIREAQAMAGTETVHLIASDRVAPVYEAAFGMLGIRHARCRKDVHTAGILAIRSAATGH